MTGSYVFDPPASLKAVIGYDKVLARACTVHIGLTLSSPGVMADLLKFFPGTDSEK